MVSRSTVSIRNFSFMARKKWTPKEEITEPLLKLREKKKWQLTLRRYVLEKNHCPSYAPYFGLGIEDFRKWIEIQFTDGLGWDNFAEAWQFEHILPVSYFDFSLEEDLKLCWNFINIRVEKLEKHAAGENKVDILAIKPYFEALYHKTGLSICTKMLAKINSIQLPATAIQQEIENYLISKKDAIETLSTFTYHEFKSINEGITIKDILLEKKILKKFG